MLPEILREDQIDTKETWEAQRRPEILKMFENWVYGVTPKTPLERMESKVVETDYLMEGAVKKETYYLQMERGGKSCGFHYRVFSPVMQKATGAILMINPFSGNQAVDYPGRDLDHMPYDLITSRGYIGVHADVDELCADDAECYQDGLWELFPEFTKGETAWGAIGMWAYAASRVIDCLIMQNFVEYGRIVVCGCSRGGKAALWCGAQDERIGLVISNVSGCTGAAVTRGKTGEHIKDITTQFPHWMCRRYACFADREEELPVDQHMLLALCAPRPLYVSSASEDSWADPHMEFEAAKLAGKAYGLYGETGLERETFPEADTPVGDGFIRYHNRQGVHGCRRYDWEQYLPFIQNHFDRKE